jgi:AmmeMemoRadiSam system protein A
MTCPAERELLLRLAREAISAHLSGRLLPTVPAEGGAAMQGGAFVTLHSAGMLRGCIGHIEADGPRGDVIVRCAVAAATEDPRFPPLTTGELASTTIELSLLSPCEPVSAADDIEIGRHGLIVEMGGHRGLLLPQVATEWGWTREEFLDHTCRKAGLPDDAWKHGARIWRFEAEVFGEESFSNQS